MVTDKAQEAKSFIISFDRSYNEGKSERARAASRASRRNRQMVKSFRWLLTCGLRKILDSSARRLRNTYKYSSESLSVVRRRKLGDLLISVLRHNEHTYLDTDPHFRVSSSGLLFSLVSLSGSDEPLSTRPQSNKKSIERGKNAGKNCYISIFHVGRLNVTGGGWKDHDRVK
ncbi:hypothetical protein PUN28_017474 [Cardiocondyla obscurior]|uniref:Uncharacterized protein n=1 Tax=Cardiocondyla obscurior TaxID=286306 RepID=A0AAW2ELC2_9HYME